MEAAKAIKIVGWIWVVIGGGMILSGVVGSVFLFLVFHRLFPSDFNMDLIPYYDFLMWFRWAYPVQFIVGIFVVVCGRRFLALQRWPRIYLEGFSWLLLVWGIVWPFIMAIGFYWTEDDTMWFFAIPVMFPCVALFAFLIYQLRSEKVRGALVRK